MAQLPAAAWVRLIVLTAAVLLAYAGRVRYACFRFTSFASGFALFSGLISQLKTTLETLRL